MVVECPLCQCIMNYGSDEWNTCPNEDCGYECPYVANEEN